MFMNFSVFIIGCLAWFALYLTQRIVYPNYIVLSDNDSARVDCIRPVIHSIFAIFLSTISLVTSNVIFTKALFICSGGYFIIDLFIIIKQRNYLFILHHLVALFAIAIATKDPLSVQLVTYGLFTELSTPFLYRWKLARQFGNTLEEYTYFIEFGYIFWLIRPIGLLCILAYHFMVESFKFKYIVSSYLLFITALILNIGWGIGICILGRKYKIKSG